MQRDDKMKINSIPELLDYFKDEQTCIDYFEKIRWPDGIRCPHCGYNKVYKTNRGYKCASDKCYKKFSYKSGTIMENAKISVRYWFIALYLCTSRKKGVSALQLHRDLKINKRTAWTLLHRTREMLKDNSFDLLKNVVQADESYFGGKLKNKHKNKRTKNAQGRSMKDKTPVVGLYEKDGRVIAFVVPNTEGATLKKLIRKYVDKNATVVSDAYRSYKGLEKEFKHIVVKHKDKENYIVDHKFHTQNIENFWSLFKRGYMGTYHYMSPKHLQRYCDEFAARYNTRNMTEQERFNYFLTRLDRRMTYESLVRGHKMAA